MDPDSIINESTFTHISRLIWNSSGFIFKVAVGSDLDINRVRQATVQLAERVVEVVTRDLTRLKKELHEDTTLNLTPEESSILQRIITTITSAVSLLIFFLLRCIKNVMRTFSEISGMVAVITDAVRIKRVVLIDHNPPEAEADDSAEGSMEGRLLTSLTPPLLDNAEGSV